MTTSDKATEILRAKLNLETGKIQWTELLRHFAQGAVIAVSPALDLVEVATRVAQDDAAAVAEWMATEHVTQVSDAQAAVWLEENAVLWSVVVKPWVLVQSIKKPDTLH